jgi:sulfide:quinone oxidoreductase
MPMKVLVLGAGFAGLELATILSAEAPDDIEVTLVDKGDAFVFGYAKLDFMFGRTTPEAVRLPYAELAKPGVRFVQEEITAINPEARRVTTSAGSHTGDVLVVALGADYDYAATPGLTVEQEFYSVRGAELQVEKIAAFTAGHAVVGVCGAPFKCPPAPSECALLLDDHLTHRGVRGDCEISLVMPFGNPVPPSPDTSAALLEAFAERGIRWVPQTRIGAVAPGVASFEGGGEIEYDLFLGVPKHRAPDVVQDSGLAVDGYIPVESATLATQYPGVYAVGDCATLGVPKAGVFSEREARVVAAEILHELRGGDPPAPYDGRGSCYIEFGAGRVGRVDVDFFGGPSPTGTLAEPSAALVAEKEDFGSSRATRWFGR